MCVEQTLVKMWSIGQLHWHCLGVSQKCTVSDPTSGLFNINLNFNKIPSDSYAHQHLENIGLTYSLCNIFPSPHLAEHFSHHRNNLYPTIINRKVSRKDKKSKLANITFTTNVEIFCFQKSLVKKPISSFGPPSCFSTEYLLINAEEVTSRCRQVVLLPVTSLRSIHTSSKVQQKY